jgi:hypothetical protein
MSCTSLSSGDISFAKLLLGKIHIPNSSTSMCTLSFLGVIRVAWCSLNKIFYLSFKRARSDIKFEEKSDDMRVFFKVMAIGCPRVPTTCRVSMPGEASVAHLGLAVS